MIAVEDYLWFVDEALEGMIGIVEDLDDELVNDRPPFPAANSPLPSWCTAWGHGGAQCHSTV